MVDFEIGTPVSALNTKAVVGLSIYEEIWERAAQLKVNEALPVTCPDLRSTAAIASAAQLKRGRLNIAVARRGLIVYLIKKPASEEDAFYRYHAKRKEQGLD